KTNCQFAARGRGYPQQGVVTQEGFAMRSTWLVIGAGAIAALAGGCSSAPSTSEPRSILEVIEDPGIRGAQRLQGGGELRCPDGLAKFCNSPTDPDSNCTCVDASEVLAELERMFGPQ